MSKVPAERVPSSAWALAEIISRAGLPAGVFNMLISPERSVGNTLIRSPLVGCARPSISSATVRQEW
ncbi:aldehyde dehydrogenase family protein [Pseudomonas monteilii]